jgi:DNA-binding SARP family transcriptional activator
LEVRAEAAAIPLRGAKVRALVAALLLEANHPVSADRLIESLWHGSPPANAHNALQAHVSQLRKVLGANRLELMEAGYVLAVGTDELDAAKFERLSAEGRTALDAGDAAAASRILGEALNLWHGPALADFDLEPAARAEVGRLEELRAATLEERIEADLRLGRHAELVAELELLVAGQPLRERLRGQLMLALYRFRPTGRSAAGIPAHATHARRSARHRTESGTSTPGASDPEPRRRARAKRRAARIRRALGRRPCSGETASSPTRSGS